MKGDLTRETFDPSQHYSAVRLQQGRVMTDADWNEQAELTRYRAELQARDTIGLCGAPLGAAGYALVAETNVLALHAVNANVTWASAEDGVLLTTSNGGADWTLIDLQTTARLHALGHAGNVGWVGGDGGVLRKTSDAGLAWSAQDAGTLQTLRGIAVFDASHAWAVGDGGVAVATIDGGAHWVLAQTGAARLQAVRFCDAFNGLAVGQGGAIVASHDGGRSWTAAPSVTTAHLRALAIAGTTHAWAAGHDGVILRSVDFGTTWQVCATPVTTTLHAVVFRDALTGWAAGDGGVLLRSVDGGASWTLRDSGTAAHLRALSLFAGDPPWLGGDGSTVLRVGAPATAPRPLLPAVNLSITPGRYYVNGVLCQLDGRCSYAHQPDGGVDARLAPGAYLLYLAAWQRHVSYLQAPIIREVALGGPDTTTRTRVVAQVKALPLVAGSPFDLNCAAYFPEWDALVHAPRPLLAARGEPQLGAASLCEIAATAGYRRLENQLYRVEVHFGGAQPTFKWSRENGSVAYAVLSVSVDQELQQTTVRVAARGRDEQLDVGARDRLELIDDTHELGVRAGVLFAFVGEGDDELELVLAGVPGSTIGQDPALHPVLRRWDHRPEDAGVHTLAIVEDNWLELEEGVQVRFSGGGTYRPGDYWQIPARTITGDVEWPQTVDGDPAARPPAGVRDAWCRLGIAEVDGDGRVIVTSDCRDIFPPLTADEQLLYVSGDGQGGAPNAVLAQPLALRVARGSVPLAGARVRFEVESGDGLVDGAPWQCDTTTDADGQAACAWTLGPAATAPGRFQRVRASLLDADRQALPGQVIVYCASAALSLQYVSGDGQQGAPGALLPQPLEVRVASGMDGADGLAGITLRTVVEQGGGTIVGPAIPTTGPQGIAQIAWRLGTAGAQRVRVELIDATGAIVQRLGFNAATTTSSGGGCATTIGRGGQYEKLDSALVMQLLKQGGNAASICFLPGSHVIEDLQVDGGGRARLSVHGSGHAAILRTEKPIGLTGFASLELRDLAIQASGEGALVLEKNGAVRVTSVELARVREGPASALLTVAGALRLSVTDCTVTTVLPNPAAVFQDIGGDCRIVQNSFTGSVGFYSDVAGLPDADAMRALLRLDRTLRFTRPLGQLTFSDNTVSMLVMGLATIKRILKDDASLLFASAVIQGNTFMEQNNVFAANTLVFTGNSFQAIPVDGTTPYGIMVAASASAVGNLAVQFGDQAILHFVLPQGSEFVRAANRVFIAPTRPVADT